MQPVKLTFYYYFASGKGEKYCHEYVCLYVCGGVCLNPHPRTGDGLTFD